MDLVKFSLAKVVSFFSRVYCEEYDIFQFCIVCLFTLIRLAVSGSIELIKAKKFAMVESRSMLEAGDNHAVKKDS